ncbi:hypothetical protein PJI16_09760 [Nitrospira sp. MA-1]|nr:hypothetical protein [Nitrospira sp. MA-1]
MPAAHRVRFSSFVLVSSIDDSTHHSSLAVIAVFKAVKGLLKPPTSSMG